MDRLLYVAMSGANQLMMRQTTNNHNLANINTVGFRADFDTFVSEDFGENQMATRVYAIRKGGAVSNKAGDVFTTGRELDIAVDNEGFIALQDDDGSEAYTRGGQLTIGPGGVLETKSGYGVLGDGGPIAIPPHELIQIGKDGSISIKPPGDTTGTMLQIDRIKLVTIDNAFISKGTNGLLKKTIMPAFDNPEAKDAGQANNQDAPNNIEPQQQANAAGPEEADGTVTVTAGALESSNVNAVDALVNMITLARQYEIQMKLMKSAEDNEATSTQLLKLT